MTNNQTEKIAEEKLAAAPRYLYVVIYEHAELEKLGARYVSGDIVAITADFIYVGFQK